MMIMTQKERQHHIMVPDKIFPNQAKIITV